MQSKCWSNEVQQLVRKLLDRTTASLPAAASEQHRVLERSNAPSRGTQTVSSMSGMQGSALCCAEARNQPEVFPGKTVSACLIAYN